VRGGNGDASLAKDELWDLEKEVEPSRARNLKQRDKRSRLEGQMAPQAGNRSALHPPVIPFSISNPNNHLFSPTSDNRFLNLPTPPLPPSKIPSKQLLFLTS
jgi:hypothetical protein